MIQTGGLVLSEQPGAVHQTWKKDLVVAGSGHLFELSALSLSDGPPVCTICSVHPLLHHCWPTCLNYPQKQQAGYLVAVGMEEIANRRQSGSGTLLCNISVIWATNSSGSVFGFPFQLQIDRRRAQCSKHKTEQMCEISIKPSKKQPRLAQPKH